MKKTLEIVVQVLAKKSESANAGDAMKYTQAALNAVNALNVLRHTK